MKTLWTSSFEVALNRKRIRTILLASCRDDYLYGRAGFAQQGTGAGTAEESVFEDSGPPITADWEEEYLKENGGNVAEISTFPYCLCTDYRCSSSPYKLKESSRTDNGNTVSLCYQFEYVSAISCRRCLCIMHLPIVKPGTDISA